MLLSGDGTAVSNASKDMHALVGATAQADYSAEISMTPSTTATSQSTSVSVSVMSPSSDVTTDSGLARLRQLASQGANGFSIVTRPAMILHDQDGNILSSFSPSSGDSTYSAPGSPAGSTPTGAEKGILEEQSKELTPEGLATLPHVPWSQDFSIQGALTSDRGWMSFTVPVGPRTNALRLAVRPELDDGSPSMAMVDQMYLLDSNGNLTAAITGIATATTASRQTLIVTLQAAPAGGVVVVRMISSPYASMSAPADNGGAPSSTDSSGGLGALTPPPSTPSGGFTVEVQRNDGSPASPGDLVVSAPFVLPPGTYLSTSSGSELSHYGSASSANLTNNAPSVEQGYALNATIWSSFMGGGPRASRGSIDVEPESESISLGPLVSRGAAPIGPALATSIDDPAPSINRDEQGGGGSDAALRKGEEGGVVWRSSQSDEGDHSDRIRLESQADDDRSPLTTLMSPGGLPSLVAAFPRRRGPSQADELAATLQPPIDLAAAERDVPESSSDRRSQQDDVAKAGIATRAVGFIVALGLASGPLYPDLIALARRRLTRKRVAGSPIRRFFRRHFPLPIA